MTIKTIPLSQLLTNPEATLNDCGDSGTAVLIEAPDHRMYALHCIEPAEQEDDSLIDNLIAHNAEFREMLSRSLASGRVPFAIGGE